MSPIPNMGPHSLTANLITPQHQAMQRAGEAASNAILAMSNEQTLESGALSAGIQNGYNASGRAGVMHDAMDQASGILSRLGQLATRASDGLLRDSDRAALQHEAEELQKELGGIFSRTSYNGEQLFQGGETETYINGAMAYNNPNGSHVTDELVGLDLSTAAGASSALSQIKNGMHALVKERAVLSNASAAISRNTNLGAAKAAVIDSIQNGRNNEAFARSVHHLSTSSTQLASAQLVHKQHLTLMREEVNRLI